MGSTAKYHREWRKKNKGKAGAIQKRYRENHPDMVLAAAIRRNNRDPNWQKRCYLKRKYKLSLEEYEALIERFGSFCGICWSSPVKERWGVLNIDHSHTTGKIRGMLCRSCNLALGLLKDNPTFLKAALSYLEHQ